MINHENTFEVFSFFQLNAIALKNSHQYLRRIHLCVFVASFKRKNDITSSNAMNDFIFQ